MWGIDFVSDLLNIPVPDKSYDVILCTEVIEHVPDPISAINEISRILKSGGDSINYSSSTVRTTSRAISFLWWIH